MRLHVLNIQDVVERQLCCGCGACAAADPDGVTMVDDVDLGRRPAVRSGNGSAHPDALRICPGVQVRQRRTRHEPGVIRSLFDAWGPVLGVWEGAAADDEMRYRGSSGGAATALAAYCLEQRAMHGVVHTAARSDAPYLNHTVMSRTRGELVAATGSRYAPASPCDRLRDVEHAPEPCVFIGKPCDVAAAEELRRLRPALDRKLGLTIAFFCAGTPTTRGTFEMLRRMGIDDPSQVVGLRYRGNGWPGRATATIRTDAGVEHRELTYSQSWDEVLQRHRQWRCHVCADHTGELADVAVGDPWYREPQPGEPGRSLILARTPRGRRIIEAAARAGYLSIKPADPSIVPRSQPNLLRTRGAIWGRMLTLRTLGVPAPRFPGMRMARFWLSALTLRQKVQSIVGTAKRIGRKQLRRRVRVQPFHPPANPASTDSHAQDARETTPTARPRATGHESADAPHAIQVTDRG